MREACKSLVDGGGLGNSKLLPKRHRGEQSNIGFFLGQRSWLEADFERPGEISILTHLRCQHLLAGAAIRVDNVLVIVLMFCVTIWLYKYVRSMIVTEHALGKSCDQIRAKFINQIFRPF